MKWVLRSGPMRSKSWRAVLLLWVFALVATLWAINGYPWPGPNVVSPRALVAVLRHPPAQGEPTRIRAPAIHLDARVVPVSVTQEWRDDAWQAAWEVADYAAGFHRGTALPGEVGNTVITGHNNTRGEVFRDLHRLAPGDDIAVYVHNLVYRYRVHDIVRLAIEGVPDDMLTENLHWIMPTADQRLTLVTCWPYWNNTHRIIVVAVPVFDR